jgi:DNA-directed RNA polymerase subunit RPC12/RpoP
MSYYCSHCGSQDTRTASTGNDPEGELIVIEQFDFADEVWDGDIEYIVCRNCAKTTYVSN